jgi:hypothetical protein
MDIEKLIALRPYVYHLTDRGNIAFIKSSGKLLSSNQLIDLCNATDKTGLKVKHRTGHEPIVIGDQNITLRDQAKINKAAPRSLTDGWTLDQYIYSLNDRIFMWVKDLHLANHFKRYANERPVILRFSTESIVNLNEPRIYLSDLNSGDTRCVSKYRNPKPRGPYTFKRPDDYPRVPSTVKEFTILNECILPDKFSIGEHPNGNWKRF